jgi:predicted MPP superfamily phosphohydrolase
MVKIGWMQDAHIRPDGQGAQPETWTDFDYLTQTLGVDDVIMTGDMVRPRNAADIPHTNKTDHEHFWSEFYANVSNPDKLNCAIPGNHEIPIQGHLDADDKAVWKKHIEYSTDGVDVLAINTHASGLSTGSPGPKGGPGVGSPRVSAADVEWLDTKLTESGSNAKLLLPHASLYPHGANGTVGAGDKAAGSDVAITGNDKYWVCQNYRQLQNIVTSYSKVVHCISHLFQTGEGYTTTNGVYNVYKDHYYDGGSGDVVHTFGLIDISSSGVTVKTIEQDRTQNTLLDVTF